VRKGLGDGHITPQPLTVMMELQNALLCISRQTGVKEVFDGSRFCDVTVVGHSDTFLSRGNRLQKDYSSKTPMATPIFRAPLVHEIPYIISFENKRRHSERSAWIGSTREARHAGITHATTAVKSRQPTIPATTSGS